MSKTIDELQKELLGAELKELFQQAYEQGLADARSTQSLPHMLKKSDLADYFQVAVGTVEHIIRIEGFPKSKVQKARYPRDKVIEWANRNVEHVRHLRQAN